MQRDTFMWIVGAGAAYYLLSTRQPQYVQQLDGSWLPATFIDRLTVAITGVAPPPPAPPTTQQNIASAITALVPALQSISSTINTN